MQYIPKKLVYEPAYGTDLSEAAETACQLAREHRRLVEFWMRGIKLVVCPRSKPETVAITWQRQRDLEQRRFPARCDG